MKPKHLYLVLCVLGLLVPYAEFIPWVLQHGLNLSQFVRELLSTRIGAFFGADVLISAIVLISFTRIESKRAAIPHRWLVVVAVLTVGVSLALPLFLYLRESAMERRTAVA